MTTPEDFTKAVNHYMKTVDEMSEEEREDYEDKLRRMEDELRESGIIIQLQDIPKIQITFMRENGGMRNEN